jgi:hypothetical protein
MVSAFLRHRGWRVALAFDEDQRQLEIVKLCVDYLKHLTTLSGAATIVVLALLDRPDTNAEALLFPAFAFGLATIISVLGMYYLIAGFAWDLLDKRAAGVPFVAVVSGMFVYALVTLILGAFVPSDEVRLVINVLLALASLIAVANLILKRRKQNPPNE